MLDVTTDEGRQAMDLSKEFIRKILTLVRLLPLPTPNPAPTPNPIPTPTPSPTPTPNRIAGVHPQDPHYGPQHGRRTAGRSVAQARAAV